MLRLFRPGHCLSTVPSRPCNSYVYLTFILFYWNSKGENNTSIIDSYIPSSVLKGRHAAPSALQQQAATDALKTGALLSNQTILTNATTQLHDHKRGPKTNQSYLSEQKEGFDQPNSEDEADEREYQEYKQTRKLAKQQKRERKEQKRKERNRKEQKRKDKEVAKKKRTLKPKKDTIGTSQSDQDRSGSGQDRERVDGSGIGSSDEETEGYSTARNESFTFAGRSRSRVAGLLLKNVRSINDTTLCRSAYKLHSEDGHQEQEQERSRIDHDIIFNHSHQQGSPQHPDQASLSSLNMKQFAPQGHPKEGGSCCWRRVWSKIKRSIKV